MRPPRPDRRTAAFAAVGALAVSNVLTNRMLPEPAYVPWNAAVATGLVGLARAAGVDPADLGLAPATLPRGLAVGAVGAGVVAGGYLAVSRAGGHDALHDRRVSELDATQARFQALVRIPLGTVALEEIAFRGVLPALLPSSDGARRRPELGSAVLFGLWHLLPSRDLVAANDAVGRIAARTGAWGMRILVVTGAAVAGVGFQALARTGHHLASPMLVHWATNALGVVASRLGSAA